MFGPVCQELLTVLDGEKPTSKELPSGKCRSGAGWWHPTLVVWGFYRDQNQPRMIWLKGDITVISNRFTSNYGAGRYCSSQMFFSWWLLCIVCFLNQEFAPHFSRLVSVPIFPDIPRSIQPLLNPKPPKKIVAIRIPMDTPAESKEMIRNDGLTRLPSGMLQKVSLRVVARLFHRNILLLILLISCMYIR